MFLSSIWLLINPDFSLDISKDACHGQLDIED